VGNIGSRARPAWLVPLLVVAGVVLLIVVPTVSTYNDLVNKRADVDRLFADMDVQLQRRNDLVPNLVNSVRGALNQEQTVFGELARARANYAGARTTDQKIAAANEVETGIGRLLAIVEAYPQLQSNQNIRDLMTQLEGTENRVAQARREYNASVTSYNASIRRFPRNIVAGMFGFHSRPLFQAVPAATNPPIVDLGNNPTTSTTSR
jgi:LemA protein